MDMEQRSKKIVTWIREMVRAAGCRGAVLGMSGGLDSSVLAVLCQRAFPENTLGLIMPCHSIDADRLHAEVTAKKFSILTKTASLDRIYDSLLQTLPDFQPDTSLSRLAQANLKARLRMVTLYYTANQLKYMVAGSSNRSEITAGYFTKYGDSGVDIMPLGNLVKSEVRELAHYLEIPEEIIDKPPSAGLWEGQTDEEEMGFSYDTLDHYILTGDAPLEIKQRIESMKTGSAHKCVTPPIADL
jgi:NAD+ synthase